MDAPAASLRIPALDERPRVSLGHAPTPIDAAVRLGDAIGTRLWVKRDDCTGLAFGGNKVRQLEFYLGEARARNADSVLITGAVQSNFVRVAAAAARRLGMEIHIQLENRVSDADDAYRRSGNVLLDRLLGAHLHHYGDGEDEAGADAALETLARSLRARGGRPYVVHLGIDHPPIGALGYVAAALELAGQMGADALFDAVVLASGSGLTHAGMLVGLRALGIDLPVYGICVRRAAALQHPRITRRVAEVAALIGEPAPAVGDVIVRDSSLAPGYGKMSDAVWSAMVMAAELEGLLLDPVYTAKALAGLVDLVRGGEIDAGTRTLFIHTGGQPALFGYAGAIEPYLAR